MRNLLDFNQYSLNELLNIKPFSNKIYTQSEMVKMGGNYHLQHVILAMIPVEKVDGLDPEPGDWHDDEGTTRDFRPGTKIEKPIEVWYDELNDKFMLYDGNHRMKQAKTNGDVYIKAFVQANSRKLYNKLLKKVKTYETFTFGNLSDFHKEDLDNELDYYETEYEFITEVGGEIKDIVNDAIKIFKSKLDIFDKIHIQFVSDIDDETIGMYVHESAMRVPVILLSLNEIYEANSNGYGIETILKPTIYHELGHAMVDIDNNFEFIEGENILKFEDEEVFVEDFAFNLYQYDRVDDSFLKLSKLYKNY